MSGKRCEHGRTNDPRYPEYTCTTCLENGELQVVNLKAWEHLTDAAKDFFHFKFQYVVVDLVWFFQKLTNTGDFGPEGHFTQKGYWKNGKPTSRSASQESDSPH